MILRRRKESVISLVLQGIIRFLGSISQSDRNKIDNFERNPKFMLLLKEVQQAKADADDDYMKTTKELGR